MEKREKVPKPEHDRTNLWQQYLEWVSLHPNVALEMETAFKWISYLVTGMFKDLQLKTVYQSLTLKTFVH